MSQVLFKVYCVSGQFAISIHQMVHGFTSPPVQNQYVKQGMGGRRSVAEDATGVVLVASPEMQASPARRLVEC